MTKTKILYVEDEPFLAQIVRESLESRQYEVIHIDRGQDVMSAFETHAPHICVLDIMLPGIDGLELGKMIKAKNPLVPIIFLTAKTQVDDVLQGFAAGGNDYLKKPFSMEELIVRVENLLVLSQQMSQERSKSKKVMNLGKLSFLPDNLELVIGGDIKKLSYRESTLLQLLLQEKEQITKRKDILMALWGDDSFYNSRNLDVYITKLREYLKADPSIEIVTVKGVGYHLIVRE